MGEGGGAGGGGGGEGKEKVFAGWRPKNGSVVDGDNKSDHC